MEQNKKDSIEKRDYQVNLAAQAIEENCIVVLPTGLGKTAIALQVIAEFLSRGKGVLFLAPTRVLVNQHFEFLKVVAFAMITGGSKNNNDKVSKGKLSFNNINYYYYYIICCAC